LVLLSLETSYIKEGAKKKKKLCSVNTKKSRN